VTRFVKARPWTVAAAIFALACATRLALILTSRFTGDEILFWDTSRKLASGTEFPLLGPSITGGGARHPGPLLYYVIAIPLLVSSAPELCNAFVALLGAASVVLYWKALRPYFGEIGALLAALMMACSPWSTLYADRIWNPNVIQIFVAMAFCAACRLRKKPSLGYVVMLFASMAAMPQLHMSSPMVWLALLPIWLPSVRKWRWHWALTGLLASAVLYIPMLTYELRTGWSNTLLFLHETSSNTSLDYRRVPAWAFRLLTLDVSYHQLHSYWGTHTEDEMFSFILHGNSDFTYGPVRWFFLALSVALAAFALGLAVFRTWTRPGRGRPAPFFWAALVGVAANTALLGFTHKDVYGHYVQSLLPFYFVAFAELGRWAAKSARTSAVVWGCALLVSIGGIDAATWVSQTMDARNGLLTMRRVIAAVEADQPNATQIPIYFDFRSSGGWPYSALSALDPKRHVNFVNGSQYRVLLREHRPPNGATPLVESGPVVLYRMR
jgi:hypothetical protein